MEGVRAIEATVAVLGDQPQVIAAARQLGWQVVVAPEQEVDLVVVPWSPDLSPRPSESPLLVVGAPPEQVARLLLAGADEAVSAGVSVEELAARMLALVRRARAERDRSPLTGLPGAARLEQTVRERLQRGETPALLLLDIDNFKAFNDRYGHWRGDAVIRSLAHLVQRAAALDPQALVAHIGGDDLCVVTRPDRVDAIGSSCVQAFDAQAPAHYDEDDRRRGYITTRARTGRRQQFRLMTLTAVAATAEAEDMEHFGQLFEVLAELKAYAKRRSGSTYFRDRRRDHGWQRVAGTGDDRPIPGEETNNGQKDTPG